MADGVVEEVLEDGEQLVEQKQHFDSAQLLLRLVEFLDVFLQSFADFLYGEGYLVVGLLPPEPEIVHPHQHVALEYPVPVLVAARVLLVEVELVLLRLRLGLMAADGVVGTLHEQGQVAFQLEGADSVDEAVLEIIRLVLDRQ